MPTISKALMGHPSIPFMVPSNAQYLGPRKKQSSGDSVAGKYHAWDNNRPRSADPENDELSRSQQYDRRRPSMSPNHVISELET
jgi:hypothetical protein